MTTSQKQRKDWVDALRAIAMLFVVFGHQAQWCDVFFQYTTPVKIPLFFAISGYLFNDRNGDQKMFYTCWFKKLVLPFFCLVTMPALLFTLYYGFGTLLDSWLKMISGESYWFITCLIVAEVIHFYIRKFSNNTYWVIIACVLCAVIGFVLGKNNLLNYAKINTALISQVFLLIGYLIKKYEHKLNLINIWFAFGGLLVYFILCSVSKYLFKSIDFDCNRNQYYNIPYCMLLIVIGCLSCFLVARHNLRYPRWLIYIGQNTFVLYLWAGMALLIFPLLSRIGVNLPADSLIVSVLQTVWATFVCMGAAAVVNRYMPFMVGKSKR